MARFSAIGNWLMLLIVDAFKGFYRLWGLIIIALRLARDLSLNISPGYCLAFIVLFFPPGDSYLNFRQPFFDIHPSWNDSDAFLADIVPQAVDLTAVQKQFARAARLVVEDARMFVWGDMRIHQPGFLPVNLHISLGKADLSGADGLNLAAGQCQTSLISLTQEILVSSFAIGGDNLYFHR
jgi:hypothetical protein